MSGFRFRKISALFFFSFLWILDSSAALAAGCNGKKAYCGKRYDEMTFVATHNSQSFLPNKVFSWLPKFPGNINNQDRGIVQQLEDGIRAFKIPLLKSRQTVYACHGIKPYLKQMIREDYCQRMGWPLKHACNSLISIDPCAPDPAATRFEEVLYNLNQFLKAHPSEVLTLFIEDFTGDLEHLASMMELNEISPLIYHHRDPSTNWPTLQQMIRSGKRLVIFLKTDTDADVDGYTEWHSTEEYVWSSEYSFKTARDLRADEPDEVPSLSKLFVLQHFVTPFIGGSKDIATVVNATPFLRKRTAKYEEAFGRKPNFIWVDFYQVPYSERDALDFAAELNRR